MTWLVTRAQTTGTAAELRELRKLYWTGNPHHADDQIVGEFNTDRELATRMLAARARQIANILATRHRSWVAVVHYDIERDDARPESP